MLSSAWPSWWPWTAGLAACALAGGLVYSGYAAGRVAAPAPAAALRLCHPDQGDHPWTLPDRTGLNNRLISQAAAQVGLRVQYLPMPWARCLFKLSGGEVDGAFNASFTSERVGMAVFPLKDGQPDPARRLMRSGYTLYQRRGEPRAWNGQTLRVAGPVGIPNGYTAMAQFLGEQGVHADQSLKYGRELLEALAAGEFAAVALKSGEGAHLLRQHPELGRQLNAIRPELSQRDFFLIFSHGFMRRRSADGERLWQAIAQGRESPAYRNALHLR